MADCFDGIRLKLSRARKEIDLLGAKFIAYTNARPYRPGVHFNSQTRILTLSVRIEETPDPMWGVQVGEVVHNLRSAFDHVVWELVILTTGRAPSLPTKNQFPIFKNKDGFLSRGVSEQLKCVRQDAVALIQSEEPFSTGEGLNCPLWHLQELSNADKHRTLHLTGTLLAAFNFVFPPLLEDAVRTDLEVATAGPIQQDAVLRRSHFTGSLAWPWASRDIHGDLTIGVAFKETTPAVGGWLVHATLKDIADRTERVIGRIGEEIFKIAL